jgi:hypothetical protein
MLPQSVVGHSCFPDVVLLLVVDGVLLVTPVLPWLIDALMMVSVLFFFFLFDDFFLLLSFNDFFLL